MKGEIAFHGPLFLPEKKKGGQCQKKKKKFKRQGGGNKNLPSYWTCLKKRS